MEIFAGHYKEAARIFADEFDLELVDSVEIKNYGIVECKFMHEVVGNGMVEKNIWSL